MSQTAPTFLETWDRAHKDSVHVNLAAKAEFLLASVGPRIAAAALGLSDARQVKRWASGEVKDPRPSVERRLDALYRIVRAVSWAYSERVAAGFLRSSNPQLEDQSPLLVLAKAKDEAGVNRVLASARAFLEG